MSQNANLFELVKGLESLKGFWKRKDPIQQRKIRVQKIIKHKQECV